jgi:hypothetical protein
MAIHVCVYESKSFGDHVRHKRLGLMGGIDVFFPNGAGRGEPLKGVSPAEALKKVMEQMGGAGKTSQLELLVKHNETFNQDMQYLSDGVLCLFMFWDLIHDSNSMLCPLKFCKF